MAPFWRTDSFNLPPIASEVGPFPQRRWLETWWEHRGDNYDELLIGDTGESLIVLVRRGNRVEFAGEPDLTDYHSPLGAPAVPALAGVVDGLPAGTNLVLDSLPGRAAEAVATSLRTAGLNPEVEQHAVAAVLTLPETFDDYLAAIGKKERHELRRKRRKFEGEAGPGRVERRKGPDAVALFADMHRRSAGDKGKFMTAQIEQFFLGLHTEVGGVIDMLVDGSGVVASAIFSFEDDTGFYLYNSAFNPELIGLSPGNVMLSYLIERSIDQGKRTFDFLKGDETYKFRLGATERPLYTVTASIGSP